MASSGTLTYLQLRKDGRVSLAFGPHPADEFVVKPEDHNGNIDNIYATLLAAYLTGAQLYVTTVPGAAASNQVSDVGFGHDPT